jgi:hypothetical protein
VLYSPHEASTRHGKHAPPDRAHPVAKRAKFAESRTLDGSHRSMAAAKLGIRPTLNVLAPDELVAADDLGTDFFQGRRRADWIAEQYRGPHNLVLDINPEATLAFREAPEEQEDE